MRRLRVIVPSAAACLSASAFAAPSNLGQVFVSPDFAGGSGPYSQTIGSVGPVSMFGTATGGFNSSGHAALHVEYGTIRASGQAFGSLNANVKGTFHDDITITAPGVPNGTAGSLTFTVITSGTVGSTSGSSGATWTLSADVGGGVTEINRSGTQYSPALASGAYVGDPVGVHTATVTFQFGVISSLNVELQCAADAANAPGPQSGEAHYGSPFVARWGGISQVKAGATSIPLFSVSSASGTNWGNPAAAYCPGDLNNDGFVDDSDFVSFATAYNTLDCADPAMPAGCPADLNADGVVDDLDFVVFAAAYNDLICP